MKSLLPFLLVFTFSSSLSASYLTVNLIEFQWFDDTTKTPKVKVNIEWDNAWYNTKNHDAVWVIVKLLHPDGWNHHAKLAPSGHRVLFSTNDVQGSFSVPNDQNGVFISPNQSFRGKIQWSVELHLVREDLKRLRIGDYQAAAFGVEMVYIPEGSFTLGDPSEEARKYHAFYQSKGDGEYGGLFEINSENQTIEVGPESGKLFYQSQNTAYQGDAKGIIPADFPKGVQAFYMMKYELQQGQYADFLNTLSASQTQLRVNFCGKDYYENRGSIFFNFETKKYEAKSPNRPCNYVTWDDAMAYADWAAMRPMTEFEFTKACRGPNQPISGEFPWGTSNKDRLLRSVTASDDLVTFNDLNEFNISDDTRDLFGASYYWVMDLAGSLWEKVVTIGDEKGRTYTGKHGDGRINGFGFANVENWPKGFDEGGYGYRGGGYYFHGRNYHEFNPHSPIAYRPYGSWSSGNRSVAYSTRMVRTAPRH